MQGYMKKHLKILIGVTIVIVTIVIFVNYLLGHTYLITHLAHTSPSLIGWLLGLYAIMLGALALILWASLRICRIHMPTHDNFLLNMYSLFINFFVIGQAGPGLRAAYLKKYYRLSIRKFILATLIYYGCYGVVSVVLIMAGSRLPWFLTLVGAILVTIIGYGVVQLYFMYRSKDKVDLNIDLGTLAFMMLATVIQAIIQIGIYFLELHDVNSHIAFKQTLAYTGVANLALFVGLTPGAIGIRESFLVFSEKLHHISSADIVAANVIDRSVYLAFLGILAVIIVSTHAKRRLAIPMINKSPERDKSHIEREN
jgi:uncharacterized membrane protein YbhN (UPF0104 family)